MSPMSSELRGGGRGQVKIVLIWGAGSGKIWRASNLISAGAPPQTAEGEKRREKGGLVGMKWGVGLPLDFGVKRTKVTQP